MDTVMCGSTTNANSQKNGKNEKEEEEGGDGKANRESDK